MNRVGEKRGGFCTNVWSSVSVVNSDLRLVKVSIHRTDSAPCIGEKVGLLSVSKAAKLVS